MKHAGLAFLFGAFFAMSATAQSAGSQSGAQAGAQASGQASVQEGKKDVQASGSASATSSASAQAGRQSASLASGTAMNAALVGSVDSKKAKAGNTVAARTTEAVKSDGKVVLPKGTKLVGHVTQASARAKGDSESALAIQFDKAVLKNGEEVALNVLIQAIAAPQQMAASTADEAGLAAEGGASAGSYSGGRGGLIGGAGGTVNTAVNTAASTAGQVAGATDATLNSTVNSTANVASASHGAVGGLNAAGQLASNSKGVFGLNRLNLNTAASNSTQGSVITSAGKNVHLDTGTRLLLVSQAQASAPPKQ